MKRWIAFLLALSMGVSLLTACAQKEPDAETGAETSPAVTAPTEFMELRRPEETQAPQVEVIGPGKTPSYTTPGKEWQELITLGILDQVDDPNRICTLGEALEMLRRVHSMRYGAESRMLALALQEEDLSQELTQLALAQFIFASDMDGQNPVSSSVDYRKKMQEYLSIESPWDMYETVDMPKGAVLGSNQEDDFVVSLIGFDFWDALKSAYPDGASAIVYCLLDFDRTTGEKLMELDENQQFQGDAVLTLAKASDVILAYYYSIEEPAQPVAYDQVGCFDSSIITPELLNKSTSLPEASCASLPASWHGVNVDAPVNLDNKNMGQMTSFVYPDTLLTEQEIQVIADAGFNFIGLGVDFSYLQIPNQQQMNETRLKELDRVIAACMARDIHVNLRCIGVGGVPKGVYGDGWNTDRVCKLNYAPTMGKLWQTLARRYAQIPNNYLSFTLMSGVFVPNEKHLGEFCQYLVDAIRKESPDRCIIAEVWTGGHTGKPLAKLGVALAICNDTPHAFRERMITNEYKNGRDIVRKADFVDQLFASSWPMVMEDGTLLDANAALDTTEDQVTPACKMKATADQYGVGFMVLGWGFAPPDDNVMLRERLNDEAMEAYLKDMTTVLAQRGWGWSYGSWYGTHGIACGYPAVKDTTYTRVGESPLYIDNEVFGWFRDINSR